MRKRKLHPAAKQIDGFFLAVRADRAREFGYPVPKWVTFCKALVEDFDVYLYESKSTRSKYITVVRDDHCYRVRFSDHKPNRFKERMNDCDFVVGASNFLKSRGTDEAYQAVRSFFADKEEPLWKSLI